MQNKKDSKNRTEPAPNSKEKRQPSNSFSKSQFQKKYQSYFAKLKSQVSVNDPTKDAAELLQILNSWGERMYLPQPESQEHLFDGVL